MIYSNFSKNEHILKYDLQFFAKQGPGGEKTEKATSKKLNDARKEGQVAKSQDLDTAAMMFAAVIFIQVFISFVGEHILESFYTIYHRISELSQRPVELPSITIIIRQVLLQTLLICAPAFLMAFATAFAINYVQVKWKVTSKPLQPKLNKLNPISGLKKIFSIKTFVEFIKSLIKVVLITYIVYDTFKAHIETLLVFYDLSLNQAVAHIGKLVVELGLKICWALLIVGIADYIFQKWKFSEDQKMTKQEIKDEYKNSEGDPRVKSQQRARMQAASRRRMMNAVPQADVVITNPTHFAVAIKYDSFQNTAPVVTAKGADLVAARIKELAKESGVEVVENKPLARMLYYNVDLDQQVPPELYKAVADILVFVYSLKKNKNKVR